MIEEGYFIIIDETHVNVYSAFRNADGEIIIRREFNDFLVNVSLEGVQEYWGAEIYKKHKLE